VYRHPCVLAVASCIPDHGFDPDRIDARHVVTRFNNLAQRNLSVLRSTSESIEWLPFAIGHPKNPDPEAELLIEADPRLVGAMRLWLAGSGMALSAAAVRRRTATAASHRVRRSPATARSCSWIGRG
jgi:hypothetical protein